MIGEAILYQFDCIGGATAGVRIASSSAGYGYGREALSALTEFAQRDLGLFTVRAKCFKENIPSVKMLSSVMEKTSEDERFFYYERRRSGV